mgnify:FL=1
MITSEDIHKLPLHEKLRIMETLWEDITRRESDLEMPQWQKDMLDERESMIASGDARFIDWEEDKKQISEATP